MKEFALGQRVEVSKEGEWIAERGSRLGVVAGFSRRSDCIRIIRDGTITPTSYSRTFWNPSSEPPPDLPPQPRRMDTFVTQPTGAPGPLLRDEPAYMVGLTGKVFEKFFPAGRFDDELRQRRIYDQGVADAKLKVKP